MFPNPRKGTNQLNKKFDQSKNKAMQSLITRMFAN